MSTSGWRRPHPASEPPNIDRARESLERITREAAHAAEVIAGVRRLASKNGPTPEWMSVAGIIGECVSIARPEMERHQIKLVVTVDEGLPPLWADRIQIQQVISNLLLNAIESLAQESGGDGQIRIAGHVRDDLVTITIFDNGPGLSKEAEQHLWEPFWTGKDGGIGLGLTMSRAIAEAHGGMLRCNPLPHRRGAAFELLLPSRMVG